MRGVEAAQEINELIADGVQRGGRKPSEALQLFLVELAASPGLKKSVKKPVKKLEARPAGESTPKRKPSVRRSPEADMLAIDELARKLRTAFESDEVFETVLSDPQTQALSKTNVAILYNRVFQSPRALAKSITKPELFNAIRRERLMEVRARM